uniref:Uncharacterized protein n=1 Tax=Mustela putorius furo TaxID=9669 RepID=M3Z7L5_MUSPF
MASPPTPAQADPCWIPAHPATVPAPAQPIRHTRSYTQPPRTTVPAQPQPQTLRLTRTHACRNPLTVVHARLAGLVQPVLLSDLVCLVHEAVLCGVDEWGAQLYPTSHPGPTTPGPVPLSAVPPLHPGRKEDPGGVVTPSPTPCAHPQHSDTSPGGRVCSVGRRLSPGGRTGHSSHLWAQWCGRVRGLRPPAQRAGRLGFQSLRPGDGRSPVLGPSDLEMVRLQPWDPQQPPPFRSLGPSSPQVPGQLLTQVVIGVDLDGPRLDQPHVEVLVHSEGYTVLLLMRDLCGRRRPVSGMTRRGGRPGHWGLEKMKDEGGIRVGRVEGIRGSSAKRFSRLQKIHVLVLQGSQLVCTHRTPSFPRVAMWLSAGQWTAIYAHKNIPCLTILNSYLKVAGTPGWLRWLNVCLQLGS